MKSFRGVLFLALLTTAPFFVFAQMGGPPGGGWDGGGGGSSGGYQLTISVTIGGDGSGSVTSQPPGISCNSGTCTANFTIGTDVRLTATPSENSVFTGWGEDCASFPDRTCDLMMSANRSVVLSFNRTNDGGGGGWDFDYYFYDPFDSFVEQIKKRKIHTVPWYLNNLINIGKKQFTGDIRKARWRVDSEGKLRGSLAYGNVLIDLVSGYSQVSFRGGRKDLRGQIFYYALGNSNIVEFIDSVHGRIYTNEKSFFADGDLIELNLLFNGPVDQSTLFGTLFDGKSRERFFITTPRPARSVSIHPLINRASLKLPASKFSPPVELINAFFENLGALEAEAASPSFSQIPLLRSKLIGLQSDETLVKQIFSEYSQAKERLDRLSTADSLLIDFEQDLDFEILYQFSDEDILDLEKFAQSLPDQIEKITIQLDKYNALNRSPDWLQVDQEKAAQLADELGVSTALASFLLLDNLPEVFVVTVVKDDEIILVNCRRGALKCEKSPVNAVTESFVRKEFINYEGVMSSYQAMDERVQTELFSTFGPTSGLR